MSQLRVGFAQLDITPPLGLPLGGYGGRLAVADAVFDPLFCRAVVLDDGMAPIALAVLDIIRVLQHWTSRVRARAGEVLGVAADRLLISATHTHAGPGVFRSSLRQDPRLQDYECALVDRVSDCLAAARRAAVGAHLRFGSAPAAGIAANRRDPSLPVDDTVRVLCAHADSGRLLGAVANFACHPTVLSATNCSYSADLFGAAAESAAHRLGAPVLLTNGAAGDVSTRFTRGGQTATEVRRLGDVLARAICTAVGRATGLALSPSERLLGVALHSLPVTWRRLPTPEIASGRLQAASRALHRLQAQEADSASIRLAQSEVEGARAQLWVSSQGGWEAVIGPRPAVAPLQALRCGKLAILGVPGELFSSAGRWLQGFLDEQMLVVGYANDYWGYFVPEQEARTGGYESLLAMVEPSCEAAIRYGLVTAARSAGCEVAHREGGTE